jgi:hypothetical protein
MPGFLRIMPGNGDREGFGAGALIRATVGDLETTGRIGSHETETYFGSDLRIRTFPKRGFLPLSEGPSKKTDPELLRKR